MTNYERFSLQRSIKNLKDKGLIFEGEYRFLCLTKKGVGVLGANNSPDVTKNVSIEEYEGRRAAFIETH